LIGMKCFSRHALLALALYPALAATPARADFYALEGRFQCLDHAGAVCFDATSDIDVTPPAPSDSVVPESQRPSPAPLAVAAPRAAPPAPIDPIIAAARRIERKAPAAGDLDMLRRSADSGDSRAVELLAWCALHGIGERADAVAAYYLYGRAAALGVAHARENQRLVYERSLTNDERQQVLDTAAEAEPSGDLAAASAPGNTHDAR
jgi:hypothetical protein